MPSNDPENVFTVLVTGGNSGLGLATCKRLIAEFLQTRPASQHLLLLPTTRSLAKSTQTAKTLNDFVAATAREAEKKRPGAAREYERRVRVCPQRLDLCSLKSVRLLATRLRGYGQMEGRVEKLDAIVCNAGIGGWTRLDWPAAIYAVLTDLVHAVTWPHFKKSETGVLARPQFPDASASGSAESMQNDKSAQQNEKARSEGQTDNTLGEIFLANVFGHYMLVHELAGLLRSGGSDGACGRVIWVSSLEAYSHAFSVDDIQGLTHSLSYESSKRLTDLLALTAHLPSTAPWVCGFLADDRTEDQHGEESGAEDARRPRMYTTHPGVCGTSILPLPWVMTYMMLAAFYLARWLGSIWHTIDPYVGATAAVWLTLVSEETLEGLEEPPPSAKSTQGDGEDGRAVGKWGSATDQEGHERVERTEVEGWGWSGRVGESSVRRLRGRRRGARDLDQEGREAFEEVGRRCWKEMERLRRVWTRRLDAAGM